MPSPAHFLAAAKPMPDAPPVITATWPAVMAGWFGKTSLGVMAEVLFIRIFDINPAPLSRKLGLWSKRSIYEKAKS
jgi:hypothetical protein